MPLITSAHAAAEITIERLEQLRAVRNVCPKAPPGMEHYSDLLMGWTKWGVLALILFAGFISVGSILVGRLGGMPRAGQMGAAGLAVTVGAAILFVTIYGILTAVVGKGC